MKLDHKRHCLWPTSSPPSVLCYENPTELPELPALSLSPDSTIFSRLSFRALSALVSCFVLSALPCPRPYAPVLCAVFSPLQEEFLQNLKAASDSLQEAMPKVLDFVLARPLTSL